MPTTIKDVPYMTLEESERFWRKVRRTDTGCCEWTASCAKGYGKVGINEELHAAHRVAYRERVGPIPEGMSIDNLCRNARCVNPHHLEPVTHRENLMRGNTVVAKNAAKTHCPRGHAFLPDNTYASLPTRVCKTCRRKYMREKYHELKRARSDRQ